MINKVKIMFVVTLVIVMLLFVPVMNSATDTNMQTGSFKAGGVPIRIPPPTSEFVEAGDRLRNMMEVFVPASNRLISAFVLTDDLPRLSKGGDSSSLAEYALVEVNRQGEYADFGANNFNEVVQGAKKSLGDSSSEYTVKAEEEINRRMKSLNVANAQVSIGKPLQLGSFFSKPNAYCFGMIQSISMGGVNEKMVASATLLLVKKRILFMYLYAEYKNDDTIKRVRKISEEWSDAILTANK